MKCSNRVGEVPEHGPELHVLLPWVAVTMHRVSWLPARIVCLDISLTMFKVSLQVHIINITLERIAKKKAVILRWKLQDAVPVLQRISLQRIGGGGAAY